MYHSVGGSALDDLAGLYSISPERFREQMAYLYDYFGPRVTHFEVDSSSADVRRVAITFDDGYSDNLEVAAPILLERGFPFTVFVTSGFVKSGVNGFLSPRGLQDLFSIPGARIGSHGTTHVALTGCDDNSLRNELYSSRCYLEDLLGSEIRSLAYPYGSVDRRVRDAAVSAGYKYGLCSYIGVNKLERDPLLLTRTAILSRDSMRMFSQKLDGHWDWQSLVTRDPAYT